MKRLTIHLFAATLLAAPGVAQAADALQSVNIRPEAATQAIFSTFDRGYVALPPGYVAFWALDDTHRAALVAPLLTLARGYVESKEFALKLAEAHQMSFSESTKPTGVGGRRLADKLVADRLREFLDLSADVDFNAQMVTKGSTICFADPKLESQSTEWKLCYRAGPKTLAATRWFAAAWLKEVGDSH